MGDTPPIVNSVRIPTGLQLYALVGAGLVFILLVAFAMVVILSHQQLANANNTTIFGFGVTILVALLGFAGLGSQVSATHILINSRMDQLLASTAANAFQRGQTAGAGAVVPNDPTKTQTQNPA